ncbi:TauD/TfdA family dioxygenase [Candidatus Frankia alpina]|uniref:TauD/TfdA dioxygenase family protein n=1 Tax=Candidatus Frankia alpina TaxID=2699483 RepID=UPI0013D67FA8
MHEVHGGSVGWHFDASSLPPPPEATVLRAVRGPPAGNDTLWASGVAAYQALTPQVRALATGRYITHGLGVKREPGDERSIVAHPLVRRHPPPRADLHRRAAPVTARSGPRRAVDVGSGALDMKSGSSSRLSERDRVTTTAPDATPGWRPSCANLAATDLPDPHRRGPPPTRPRPDRRQRAGGAAGAGRRGLVRRPRR